MKRNITIGYILAFINELYLPIAVWLLFFLKHMDFTQVAFIGALSTVSSNLFEIPTGAIADIIGRKWTLFWSFILSTAGLLVIATGNIFIVFALGRVINGIGTSLFSGTHESLLYDSLKQLKKDHEYDRVVSRSETMAWIGLFFAAISGGVIYDIWNTGPFYISAFIYLGAALACLFIQEPSIDSEIFDIKSYISQNIRGFQELFKNSTTTRITLLMVTVSSAYFIAAKILGISQAEEYGLSGTGVGILFGVGYIIAAISSHYYPYLRKKLGNTTLLIATTGMLVASFVFAKFVGVVFGSLLIIMRISSSTAFNNAKSVIMNRYITSKNRATALSTAKLLSEIPFTVSFILIGSYIDKHGPNMFALLLGGIMVIALVGQLIISRREIKTWKEVVYAK